MTWTISFWTARALVEHAKNVEYEQDEQYCAEPYSSTSAVTPAPVAVVTTAATKNQQQNHDQ